MFTPEEVKEIRKVAQSIRGNAPSPAQLGGLVERACSWPLAALCMEIDAMAAGEKLAIEAAQNQSRADEFKALICMFPGDCPPQRNKRATALRYVNKLRGQRFWEPPNRRKEE